MPPKHLNSNAKRTRPRAPGVKAGLELMASLGGISVLGTQQTPYYYFPPEKRIRAGVDRCERCVTACGPKAACNVQPLLRVGTNLWKGRQCYYCTIFPAELQGETCSLDGALYVYDGDRRRLMAVNAKGEIINRPIDDLDLELPDLPTPADETPVETPADTPVSTPPPASPILEIKTIDAGRAGVTEAKAAPTPEIAATKSPITNPIVTPAPIEIVKVTNVASPEPSPKPTAVLVPVRLSPEWSHKPKVSAPTFIGLPTTGTTPAAIATVAPSTPVNEPVSLSSEPATPEPSTPAAASEPATPIDSVVVTPAANTPAAVSVATTASPSTLPEYQWLKDDLSLVNRKAKAAAAAAVAEDAEFKPAVLPAPAAGGAALPSLAPAAVITEASPKVVEAPKVFAAPKLVIADPAPAIALKVVEAPKPAPVVSAPKPVVVEAPKVVATPAPVSAPKVVEVPKPAPVVAAPAPKPVVVAVAPASKHVPTPVVISNATPAAVEAPIDPLAQLAVSRRPLAALQALSKLLEKELQQLNDANAEVERLRALVRAKETERDVKAARVERYRCAIDDALTALEEERNSLMRMRATLAAALALES